MAKAKKATILIIVGAVFGTLALGLLLLAAVYLLSAAVQPWLAAMLVAFGAAVVGGALAAVGARQMKLISLPPRTVISVQENIQWAKAQAR
jgi:membrane protein